MVTTTLPRRALRFGARVALVALPGIATVVLAPAWGWAADGLTSATPADGSALARPPQAVVLTFSAPADPGQSHVSTRDGSGVDVASGEPTRTGATGIRLPVSARSDGDYTVAYHVVLDDGAQLTGLLRFSVGTGVPPRPLSADQARQAQQGVSAGHEHSVDPVSGGLLLADVVVLVAVLLMLAKRRRPTG